MYTFQAVGKVPADAGLFYICDRFPMTKMSGGEKMLPKIHPGKYGVQDAALLQ